MSTTDSISATERALRSLLRQTRSELDWQKASLGSALKSVSRASAQIEQAQRDEAELLAALAQNGWLTDEDTSELTEEKVPF